MTIIEIFASRSCSIISVYLGAETILGKILYLDWSAGSGGRRKREGLLDNVDPATPVPSNEEPLEEPSTQLPSARGPEAGTSGWGEDRQNGTDRSSPEPGMRIGKSTWDSSSQKTDDNGWSAGPKPEADEWGWGFDRGRPAQSHGARKGGSEAWPSSNGAGKAEEEPPPPGTASAAGEGRGEAWEGAWDEEDGPDIVELRPEEVVQL